MHRDLARRRADGMSDSGKGRWGARDGIFYRAETERGETAAAAAADNLCQPWKHKLFHRFQVGLLLAYLGGGVFTTVRTAAAVEGNEGACRR